MKCFFFKFYYNGMMIPGFFDLTIELCMAKYTLGEILSSRGATLYKNPSDQTVIHLFQDKFKAHDHNRD